MFSATAISPNATANQSRAQRSRSRQAERLVIIGNGMAGQKLCEKLVTAGTAKKFQIVVFGAEKSPAYDRVHLTEFLRGRPPENLLLASESWYAENDIQLHLGDPVTAIDRERRTVCSASGVEVNYDRLVFATGSHAFVPPIDGRDLPGVFVYRTIDDLERLKAYAVGCRRAAVLGGGLLGLEAASALHDLNLQTWVVERGASLLARQLDPQAGALLQAHVEKLGIKVCTQRETERIEAIAGQDRLLQFNTGECLRVQLVVIAAGIRPNDSLARQYGLEIAPRGGIRVNDSLQTSDPAIFAIGECASHNGICYGLAAPGYKMADALAENFAGKRRKFTGADQSTRLKLAGIEVATLGDFQTDGETLRWSDKNGFRQIVMQNRRLVGATAVGEWPETSRAMELIERRAFVWRWQVSRFNSIGRLWSGTETLPVTQWPAAALVCNCVGVRRSTLTAACAEGCTTVEQLARRTGASTVCGSCKPLLAEFVGAPAQLPSLAGIKLLAVTCGVALLLGLTIFFAAPVPFAESVQAAMRKLDALWREDFLKQVTGFTLVGLALVSLLLSVRKRVKKISWGDFSHWRAVHAALGTATLIALVTHTGFRLGHNLNFVLMTNFLVLALVGALAGAVTALERRLSPQSGKRLRSFWTGAHIAMAWPLPVLVAAHVLTAYYF